MFLFDTHSHLNCDAYDSDRDEVIKRSLASRVGMINVGTNKETSRFVVELAQKNAEGIFSSVALHPEYVFREDVSEGFLEEDDKFERKEKFDLDFYFELAKNSKVVAIGETGLDYSISQNAKIKNQNEKVIDLQKSVLIKHLEIAEELRKPVIIHCRKAHGEILEALEDWQKKHGGKLRGVAHSFLGNYKQARRYREMGFKIAFNGIITYARDYDKVIQDTPIKDILIETDCPYLTPAPYRRQRNEPMYVLEVARKLAEIKGMSLEEVARQTTENAREVFGV